MKTWNAKPGDIDRKWWIVDATDKALGRVATEVSRVLRGKNKPQYTPHADTGDFVVIINSEKIRMTGRKMDQKKYYTRSRFFGSLKEVNASEMIEKDPEAVIMKAVRGMMPDNRLARQQLKKLKAYRGADHPHQAQKPETLTINA